MNYLFSFYLDPQKKFRLFSIHTQKTKQVHLYLMAATIVNELLAQNRDNVFCIIVITLLLKEYRKKHILAYF